MRKKLANKKSTVSRIVAALVVSPLAIAQTQTDEASTELEEVIVTGIRGSILAAQEIKRDAATVVEAITTEDLGKFSDTSVSDALSRVPGVQVTKNEDGDGGDTVAIRGLGAGFTATTLNGRSLLTSGGGSGSGIRGFNVDQIPTEILSSVLIYKSPQATLVPAGLAGLIDYQTLKPLDYNMASGENFFGSVTARADYDTNNEETSPRLSGVLVYKSDDERFGAYLSAVHSEDKKRDDSFVGTPLIVDIQQQATAGGPITVTNDVAAYNEVNFAEWDIDTDRDTAAVALQFRPNDSLDFTLDGVYTKYDRTPRAHIGRSIFGPNYYSIYDGVFAPGGISIENSRVVQVDSTLQTGGGYPVFLIADQDSPNKLDTYTIGGNLTWRSGEWMTTFDAAYTDVDFERVYKTFYALTGGLGDLASTYDTRGGSIPAVTFPVGDYLDPAGYANYGFGPAPDFFGQNQFSKKDRFQAKFDVQRALGDAFVAKFGARFEETNEDYRTAQLEVASYQPPAFQIPASSEAALRDAFLTGGQLTTTYGFQMPGTDVYGACAVVPSVCSATNFGRYSFAGGLPADPDQYRPTTFLESGKDAQPFVTSGAHIFRETTQELYFQLDAVGELFGMSASGNIGVRAINIEEEGTAYSGSTVYNNPLVATVISKDQQLVSANHDYWETLPSLNLKLSPKENVNLRFSVARVISLPDIGALTPENNISYYDPNDPRYSASNHGFGGAGNIALKPTSSWNYDLTAEYYTANEGAFIASVFYKDISDFVLGDQVNGITLPGYPGLFDLSSPVNFSDAYAQGFELGLNQPFTFLPSPFDGFGIQANYTYVDSELDKQSGGKKYGIPGSSKDNFNAILYYEKYGFGARVAYNYRSDYFLFLGSPAFAGNFVRYVAGDSYLDASLSYTFNEHFSLQLSAANITETEQVQYNEFKNFPLAIYQRPATYSLSFTTSF